MWGQIVLLVALAGTSVFAEDGLTFPELARQNVGQRIVSGWPAGPGQIAHQLSIRMVNTDGGVSSCGASIIHHNWAITAAHCTAQRVTMVIRAGTVNLTRPGLIFETTEYYNHPEYNEAIAGIVQPNDIGVIKFNKFVEYNDLIKPIRIQRHEDRATNYDQVRMTASGWGLTWTAGTAAEHLNWVYLSGVTNLFCQVSFGFSPIIQPSTICARGYNDTTQSTCQGDSGGPLTVVEKDGKVTLVGVTSFVSAQGCHADMPAGFIRAGFYHEWLNEVTGINFDWEFEDSEEASSEEGAESQESNENSVSSEEDTS